MDTTGATATAATVIIGQRVRAGSERAFEAWQKEHEPRGSQVSRFHRRRDQPTHRGSTRVGGRLRFDSIAHVQAWINSATRQKSKHQLSQ